jgi:hypothetical protein
MEHFDLTSKGGFLIFSIAKRSFGIVITRRIFARLEMFGFDR